MRKNNQQGSNQPQQVKVIFTSVTGALINMVWFSQKFLAVNID
jgi:hypothetical protein